METVEPKAFTEVQIAQIKQLLSEGKTRKEVAAVFGFKRDGLDYRLENSGFKIEGQLQLVPCAIPTRFKGGRPRKATTSPSAESDPQAAFPA